MSEWAQTRLRYVSDLNPPVRADLLAALGTELSFLPMDSIGENGSLNLERTRSIAEVRNGYSYFEDGDVAFAKVTPCFENGKGALMQGLEKGAGFGTTEITILRPKTGTNARYLRYIVQSERFRQLGVGAMTGAGGLKRVPDDFTRDFKTVWPGAVDQERIANFLDDKTARIDALIAEKIELAIRLREYRSALVSSSIAGELSPNSHFWVTTRLRFVADLNPSIRADLLKDQNIEVSFLPMDAIGEDGSIDLDRTRSVAAVKTGYSYFEDGDIAFAKVTPCFENGKGALMRGLQLGAGFGTTEVTVLRPKTGTNAGFLNYVVQSEPFRRLGFGAMTGAGGLKRVPDDFTRDFKVLLPPMDEQVRLVTLLDQKLGQIEGIRKHVVEHIARLREYRSSLISAAVTGQLNLGATEVAV